MRFCRNTYTDKTTGEIFYIVSSYSDDYTTTGFSIYYGTQSLLTSTGEPVSKTGDYLYNDCAVIYEYFEVGEIVYTNLGKAEIKSAPNIKTVVVNLQYLDDENERIIPHLISEISKTPLQTSAEETRERVIFEWFNA